MDALCALLSKHNVALIEDCAHTMGASWGDRKSGNFGVTACFSTQTYKHINSGEGGFITTDDKDLIARAIILSGSYMLYERHKAAPQAVHFDQIRLDNPNYSGRMDNLRAAILRPQLKILDENCRRWNKRYRAIEKVLAATPGLRVPQRPQQEHYVGSSIQFLVDDIGDAEISELVDKCRERGVEIKWFGTAQPTGYTSRHDSWRYVEKQNLPESDRILCMLCDLRIPLTFTVEDCHSIGEIIGECVAELRGSINAHARTARVS
jgi:dTDP-4-amino-4,6-dideoxygalactose transaminase